MSGDCNSSRKLGLQFAVGVLHSANEPPGSEESDPGSEGITAIQSCISNILMISLPYSPSSPESVSSHDTIILSSPSSSSSHGTITLSSSQSSADSQESLAEFSIR